jgi:DNA-binding NarL/FixJ family response regulator
MPAINEMPGLGRLASITRIREIAPVAQVLMLSAHSEESDVIEALFRRWRGWI